MTRPWSYPLALPFAGVIIAFGSLWDAYILLFFALIRQRHRLLYLVEAHLNTSPVIHLIRTVIVLAAAFHTTRYIIGLRHPSSSSNGFPAKPMLFPCNTSHARLSPKRHSFVYSYLMVGIPIGWWGYVGGILSSEVANDPIPWYWKLLSLKARGAWFTINGDDYLERGHVDGGLEQKLKNYLKSQGIDHELYPHAYLFTAPRFLGYASNPVSIWNLYCPLKKLRAVILEVNNTYGERHMHFVNLQSAEGDYGFESCDGKPSRYSTTFPKTFYLSVFDSRTGTYNITITDALSPAMTASGPVNVTITLSSTRSKVVGRLWSTGSGIDPESLSLWGKTTFLAQWWWVGLATTTRARIQGLTLLYRTKLTWAIKPEPKKENMPRRANKIEIFLENIFRRYLGHVLERTLQPAKVRYIPAGVVGIGEEVMYSPSAHQKKTPGNVYELEIRVLTPLFYSRLLYYTFSALSETLLAESQLLNQTIFLSDTDNVTSLFARSQQDVNEAYIQPTERLPYFDTCISLVLYFLAFLNGPGDSHRHHEHAPRIKNCETTPSSTAEFPLHGTRDKELASQEPLLIAFLITPQNEEKQYQGCSAEERRIYATSLLFQTLARYITGGSTDILILEIKIVKFCILWYLVHCLFH